MSTFSIPGQPCAYRVRHQHVERDNFIEVAKSIYTQKPLKGPIIVHLNFVMAIPRKMKGRFQKGEEISHTAKPDLDALTRFALLYLEHIAFRNQSQIVQISAHKCYGRNPRTDVMVSMVNPPSDDDIT